VDIIVSPGAPVGGSIGFCAIGFVARGAAMALTDGPPRRADVTVEIPLPTWAFGPTVAA
jgi:hypothetical protein